MEVVSPISCALRNDCIYLQRSYDLIYAQIFRPTHSLSKHPSLATLEDYIGLILHADLILRSQKPRLEFPILNITDRE